MKHNTAKNALPSECEKGYRRWISPSNKAVKSKVKPPPEPDPFDEWWKDPDKALNEDFNTQKEVAKVSFNAGWDAAIKWKEGQK